MTHRVAVVGAGGVGRRRAAAAAANPRSRLCLVCDVAAAAASRLADEHGVGWGSDWGAVVGDRSIDVVVVSTTHDALAAVSAAALEAGKHVLCEKPLGRQSAEVRRAVEAARVGGRVLRAGYNHRFHPAVRAARQAAASGRLGELMFLRGRYGHGGRPGYETEWRADPERSGGGELLDQGAHLIDLFLWILGTDFATVFAHTLTSYWDTAVEDNAFALFRTAAGQVASLHASWTQWRNLFSLEVFGTDGYAVVEGLGGSYGPERLVLGRRRPQGGVPEEEEEAFGGTDESWTREWDSFLDALEGSSGEGADGAAGLQTLSWIERAYRSSRSGVAVSADRGAGEGPRH